MNAGWEIKLKKNKNILIEQNLNENTFIINVFKINKIITNIIFCYKKLLSIK